MINDRLIGISCRSHSHWRNRTVLLKPFQDPPDHALGPAQVNQSIDTSLSLISIELDDSIKQMRAKVLLYSLGYHEKRFEAVQRC